MSDTQADALRAEWESLREEHADLVRQTDALHGSSDGQALRAHTARLHAHIDRLHLLMVEMEKHHKATGPVGGLTNLNEAAGGKPPRTP